MLGINIHLIQSAAVTRLYEAVYAHTRGSILWESSNRACWLSMTCRWWTYGFSSWCSFEGTSLPARQETGHGSESQAVPASLSCALQSPWHANLSGARQSQGRRPVIRRTCCLSAMREVTARCRRGEKKERNRQCWAASVHRGTSVSKKLALPKWKIYSCWQFSPTPARVVQSSLCAALAVHWDLQRGWAPEPVTFKQP